MQIDVAGQLLEMEGRVGCIREDRLTRWLRSEAGARARGGSCSASTGSTVAETGWGDPVCSSPVKKRELLNSLWEPQEQQLYVGLRTGG